MCNSMFVLGICALHTAFGEITRSNMNAKREIGFGNFAPCSSEPHGQKRLGLQKPKHRWESERGAQGSPQTTSPHGRPRDVHGIEILCRPSCDLVCSDGTRSSYLLAALSAANIP